MSALEDLGKTRLALSVYLQAVFNEAKVLDARDWKIYGGIARYFSQPQVPFGVTDTERAKRLKILARYAVVLQKQPLASADGQGEVVGFNYPSRVEEANSSKVRVVPSFFFKRRADLVWDDEVELAACDFTFPEVATNLTLSTRMKVYGGSLGQIKPPASDQTGGFFDNGSLFYSTAATQATYDTAATDQLYYPKWLAPSPVKPEDRQFTFAKLSDDYLRLNYQPYDLEKGAVHLYLAIGQVSLVAKLFFDAKHRLTYDAILGQRLPTYGNYFEIITNHIKELKKKDRKVQGEAWFVYTLEGTDHPPKFSQMTAPSANLSLNVMEQVVDPQIVVMSTGKLTLGHLDPLQRKWGSHLWLKEMVRLRFSEPWVWFWKNSYIEMFYTIDREQLFLKDLRSAESKAVGPLKDTLKRFVKEADADPNLYLVRRGSKYGPDKRVIGSDESYVYFYNNKERLVTRLPMFVFWRDMNVSQISSVIYANTRGMIPFCKVVVWAGVFVMGWAVAGTEMLVMGFRQYAQEKIRGIALDKLLKATWDKFKLRIMVLLIFPLLEFFHLASPSGSAADPSQGSAGGSAGGKIYALIKGFAEGFSEHSLHSLMDRWTSFFNLEPASYRAVKLIMKIEAILRWVDEKMSALKDYVSDTVAKLLLNRLVSVVVQAGTGFIGVIDNLYFLDYDRVKEYLKMYSELSGERMPTKAEWDRLRHKHFLETFRYWNQAVKDEAKDIKAMYDDVQYYIRVSRWVAKGAVGAVLVHILSAGGLLPMIVMAFRAAGKGAMTIVKGKPGRVVGGGLVVVAVLDDDFRKQVFEFFGDFGEVMKDLPSDIGGAATYLATPAAFAWGTKERMARFGQLLGIIVACLVVSKAVIKEGKWKDRWAKSGKSYPKFLGKHLLVSQLNVNPLLPAIKLALYHYVQLIEKVIAESKKSFEGLENEIEEILLGDPAFRDIIEVDEGLTIAKLIAITKAVDKLLLEWLNKLASIPGLTERMGMMAESLKNITPDKMPTLEELRDGTLSEGEWLREAFMFAALSHMQGGISRLREALESMLEPVNPKDPTPVSVGFVFQTLGFNLQDVEAEEVLDRNFDEIFPAPAP